jgi:uncharacterized protein (TIGR00369 family)
VNGGLASPIAAGFKVVDIPGAFITELGPIYGKWTGERLLLGFPIEERHGNTMGVCHGGVLATLADMMLPLAALYQMTGERRFIPTISLSLDYLSPAPIGAWVEGEVEILRETPRMMFGQGIIRADGQSSVRMSGVYRLGDIRGDGKDSDPFKLKEAT